MSKLFKILVFLTLICLSCTAIFACGAVEPDDPKEESESILAHNKKQISLNIYSNN